MHCKHNCLFRAMVEHNNLEVKAMQASQVQTNYGRLRRF